MGTTKRSRADLYATVLEVIRRYPEGGRITRISYGVGVPVDRLKNMVESLCSFGLVTKADEGQRGILRGDSARVWSSWTLTGR